MVAKKKTAKSKATPGKARPVTRAKHPEGFEEAPESSKLQLAVGESVIVEILEYKPDVPVSRDGGVVSEMVLEVEDLRTNMPKTWWPNKSSKKKIRNLRPSVGDRLSIIREPDGKAPRENFNPAKLYDVRIQRAGETVDPF